MFFRFIRSDTTRFGVIVLLILLPGISLVQGQSSLTRGSLSGAVTDAAGAAIPGAEVSITSRDTAANRDAKAGADGSFMVRDLPSGTYTVQVSAPGFQTYRNDSVAIAVGRNSYIDAQLVPAKANAEVTVRASTSALDTSQSSPVTNVDRGRIEELPIPSRNYLNFALLAPAVAAANPALARQQPGTAESGLSVGGLRPSSNALDIDGVDDNDEFTGLSRTELSPEAISDFQIVNHGYAAQSGGSSGGAVDVETRSGAGVQHGDAFLFVQNGAFNASPSLENVLHKPDESRLRAGLSTGGSFQPARTFYYGAVEQEMARGEEAGDFNPQTAAIIDSILAQPGPLRGFQLQQGFFPTIDQETEFSLRLDRAFARDALMLRFALTNNRAINDAFHTEDNVDLSGRGSAFYDDNGVNGLWSRTFSSRLMNQLSFELAQRRVALRTGSQSGLGAEVAGIAEFGTPYAGNSRRYETHFDLGDDIIRQTGKHLMQAGIAEEAIALRASVRDGFEGLYVFPNLAALENREPDFFLQSFGNPETSFRVWRTAAYIEDHWTTGHGLTLDYGLRYEFNHLPTPLPQKAVNLSPRLGFAWSPAKRWILRGGFGTYFDRYLLATINRIREFDGRRAQQQIAEGAAATSLYQSGSAPGTPVAGIASSIWTAAPRLPNPYAETASIGVERALPASWTASGEYRFVHGIHMGRTFNMNLPPPTILTVTNASGLGIVEPTPQQLGRPVFAPQRLNPAYDAIDQFQTDASSTYHGATFSLNRQFTEDFELMAGYTYSRAFDDASLDIEEAQNPYDPGKEQAPSLNDRRQRFVLSGLYFLGPDLDDPRKRAKAHRGALERMLYGVEFAPLITVESGFRDNPLTGVDSNREHIYPFAARPLAWARNSLQTPSSVEMDLRVLKMFPIWRGHLDVVGESFNLLNRQNIHLLNSAYGSGDSATFRFAQPLQVGDPRKVQFSLDFEY